MTANETIRKVLVRMLKRHRAGVRAVPGGGAESVRAHACVRPGVGLEARDGARRQSVELAVGVGSQLLCSARAALQPFPPRRHPLLCCAWAAWVQEMADDLRCQLSEARQLSLAASVRHSSNDVPPVAWKGLKTVLCSSCHRALVAP
jgi:hypothetical protein